MISSSQNDAAKTQSLTASPAIYSRPVSEWIFWIVVSAIVYSQTGNFDQEIAEYAFGATGWPRALCMAMIIGATCQLIYQIATIRRGKNLAAQEDVPDGASRRPGIWPVVQRIGIFVAPLIYLYLMPSMGFYVATPLFIIVLLILFEVKTPAAIATVTIVVYGIMLLLFTRLFYVALPTGSIPAFYDINNKIIEIVRIGM